MDPWERVLEYWFGNPSQAQSERWFRRDDAVDADIRTQFGRDLTLAGAGELDEWAATARGRLALIIVLDQFSRNIHRDSGAAYAHDTRAQDLCLDGLERGLDRDLDIIERWFFYMPLMHAENLALQDRSVGCFRQLLQDAPPSLTDTCTDVLGHAEAHRNTIVQFGRFPYRNDVLGRVSTAQELQFLAERNR